MYFPFYSVDAVKSHSTTGPTETGDGPEMMQSFPGTTGADPVPGRAPCFLDDVFAVMHDSLETNDELANSSLTLFGVCTASHSSSGSILLELAKKSNIDQRNQLEILHPSEGENIKSMYICQCHLWVPLLASLHSFVSVGN